MKPSIGRTVLYTLAVGHAAVIQTQRRRLQQAGNGVKAGQIYPMVIVRVWGEVEGSAVNGRVLLDGDDTYWATSRCEADEPTEGRWHVPPRV